MPTAQSPKRQPTKRSTAKQQPSGSPRPAAGRGAGDEGPADPQPATTDPQQEAADRDTVVKALTRMYGIGTIAAQQRLAGIAPATIAQMAEQERIGRRDRIPAILAGAATSAR